MFSLRTHTVLEGSGERTFRSVSTTASGNSATIDHTPERPILPNAHAGMLQRFRAFGLNEYLSPLHCSTTQCRGKKREGGPSVNEQGECDGTPYLRTMNMLWNSPSDVSAREPPPHSANVFKATVDSVAGSENDEVQHKAL